MNQYEWPIHGYETSTMMYGCMNIGGTWDDTPVSDAVRRAAFAALDAAREAGYTAFDHADIYCAGKSERVFGEWLAQNPGVEEEILIQSKCGIRIENPTMFDFSYEHILESVDRILERLTVDHLDVLLLHRPDPLVEPEEVAAAFDDLHRQGLVRSFGVSNHSAMQMELLSQYTDHPLVANQMEVSLAHPDLLLAGTAVNQREPQHAMRPADTVEYCRMEGVTLQAWSPLARGVYSGREKNSTASLVAEIAAQYGVSPEAIVLAWVMRHPAPILPVVGSTNPARIAAAAQADTIELDRRDWYRLAERARGMGMP